MRIYTVQNSESLIVSEAGIFASPLYFDPAMTQNRIVQRLTLCNEDLFQLEGKRERQLINLDKVVDHETGPGNPSHAAIAIKVHCRETCMSMKIVEKLNRMMAYSRSWRGHRGPQ
jgi:hypothetical protein